MLNTLFVCIFIFKNFLIFFSFSFIFKFRLFLSIFVKLFNLKFLFLNSELKTTLNSLAFQITQNKSGLFVMNLLSISNTVSFNLYSQNGTLKFNSKKSVHNLLSKISSLNSFSNLNIHSCRSLISHNSSREHIIHSLSTHLNFLFHIIKSGDSFVHTFANGTYLDLDTFGAQQTTVYSLSQSVTLTTFKWSESG